MVIVLIVVSFAAVISVMFLLSAGQERAATNSYAEGSTARELSSQAVNIVIGQINAATHEGTMAAPISWASQPGMIRTYNSQGNLSHAYKLYSWSNLTEADTAFNPNDASELPVSSWSAQPALYTDINQPVNQTYPIVDPAVLDKAVSNTAFNGVTNPSGIQWDFPGEAGLLTQSAGYYPSTATQAPMPVQWLYVLRDGTWAAPTNPSGKTVTVANATADNPIVGRIAFWTDDESCKVNVNTAGEGAYWDTPKAGTVDELQFAANPPLQNEYQRLSGHPATTSLSAVLPELLGGVTGFSRWNSNGGANSSYLTALQSIFGYGSPGDATAHGLNPRVLWGSSPSSGGSQGGTYPVTSRLTTYEPQVSTVFPSGYVAPSTYQAPTNTDRLYTTAEDVYFQPGSSGTRTGNVALSNGSITPQTLARREFFLTAESSAPETTLFDTPRVCLWPITWPYANASYYASGGRTIPVRPTTLTPSPANLSTNPFTAPQEKLIAFCGTLNAGSANASTIYPYYFQRQNPDSPTYDWTNITRNQNLVNYLSAELGAPTAPNQFPNAPGIGASLGTKWDGDAPGTTDWITLNCFDFIRSRVNQYTLNADPTKAGQLLYAYTGVNFGSTGSYAEPNSYSVSPLNVTLNGNRLTTEGTYPALREASLVFYATARNTPRLQSQFLGNPVTKTKLSDVVNPTNWSNLITWDPTTKTGNSQTTKIRMVMLLNFSGMNPGIATNAASANGSSAGANYSVYHPVFWVKVSTPAGSSPFRVNGGSINFPLGSGNVVQFNPINTAPLATSPGWESSLYANATTAKTFSNTVTPSPSVWSLISDEITLTTAGAENFTFIGSKVQFDIYAIDPSGDITKDPTGNTANLVYSYQMDFSQWNSTNSFNRGAGNFPVPLAPFWNTRQGLMMVSATPGGAASPVSAAQQQAATTDPTVTTTVSGGVLMPYNANIGTTVGATGTKNWQAEIVTRTALLTNVRTNSSPQQNFPWGAGRTFGSDLYLFTPRNEDYTGGGGSGFSTPFMYVYQDSAWDGNNVPPIPVPTSGSNYSSTVFGDRVRALILNNTSPAGGLAEAIDNHSPYGFTVPCPPNQNPVGFGLFVDTPAQFSDADEAYGLITPYDTVISMVADPRLSTNATAGDPRLTGRGLAGGRVVFAALSNEQVCATAGASATDPNHIYTTDASNTPACPFPLAGGTIFDPRSGLSTFGAQYHELDSTGAVPSTTGVKPQWQFVGTSQTPRTGSPMAAKGGITLTSLYPNTGTTNIGGFLSNGLLMGYNDASAGVGLEGNVLMSIDANMDWTRQPGSFPDGAYIVRPDQEYQSLVPKSSGSPLALNVPFFNDNASLVQSYNGTNVAAGFFSPTRQIPSPVIMGTLPDSLTTGWQTLNFCPNPAATINTTTAHPGQGNASAPTAAGTAYTTAPDHLLLDLFWMPVSEPYPISGEFATAGKVNLNYAMMPFPYIQRKTALDALLKSVWITAMPDPSLTPTGTANGGNQFPPFPQNYKSYGMLYQLGREDLTHTRYPINVNATLRAFDYKFQQGDIFRAASQICDMFLYPNDPNTPNTLWAGDTFSAGIGAADTPPSTTNIMAWWKANSFTADNEREAPYNAIYSRITTKSNAYTVHWRVQTIQKSPSDPTHWTEGTDKPVSELRGSTLIERYLDPGTPLPDYATNTAPKAGDPVQPLSYYYKWRVAQESYFQPLP